MPCKLPASIPGKSRISELLAPHAEVERRAVKNLAGPDNPQFASTITCNFPVLCPAIRGRPIAQVSVQFQYPYQFSLPFTSVNMQKIMLNAGVQMTGEY